jgi:surface protein
MSMQINTQKHITELQAKAQAVTKKFNKEIVIVTKGIQHIQAQKSTVYQLNTKDLEIEKSGLIAKKVGDNLEVILEDGVIIFDNYFDVCATDLSCLVSLPVEGGGLYHIVAEVFFTLEDSTQVVYFYGNQSIVSTESSVVSNNQSFYDVVTENIGIVAAVLVGAVVIGSGSGDNNKDDDDAFSLNGTFSAGMYKGGNVENAVFIYDKNGNQIANVGLKADGTYTISVDDLESNYKAYTGTIYIRLKASSDIKFMDEATNAEATLLHDLYSIATLSTSGSVIANINVQTTIVTQVIVSGTQFSVTNNGQKLIVSTNNFTNTDTTKIASSEAVVRNAFGLKSNIFTTKVDTINSVDNESNEGNVKAGQIAASLSGAATTAGDFQAIINDVARDIYNTNALTDITVNKLIAGSRKVQIKMKTDASQAVADASQIDKAQALVEQIKINTAADKLVADTTFKTSPITNAGFMLSADTGAFSNDLITKTTAQNVTTTLNNPLESDENIWLSINNGDWIKGTVTNNTQVTWLGINLNNENTNTIRVVVAKTNDKDQVDAEKTSIIASKESILDTVAPTVKSVVINATDNSDAVKTDTLKAGDKIVVSIIMSEAVTVTDSTNTNKPIYKIKIGDTEREATYVSGSGTNTLKFSYTIIASEMGNVTAETDKLLMNSSIFTDIAGNTAILASPAVTANTPTVDSKAPDAPTDLVLETNNQNNITNKTTVTITGKAEVGATITLFNGNTPLNSTATIIVNSDGNFRQEVLLTVGLSNITAKATDTVGNESVSSDVLSITVDTTNPTATLSGNMAANFDLLMTFSEAVTAVSGKKITLYKKNGTQVEEFDVTSSKITINDNIVSINPTSDLTIGEHYVKIDVGAFKDMAGNDYAGISDINTWNFSIRTLVTTAVWSINTTDVASNGINAGELDSLSITGVLSNPDNVNKNVVITGILFKAKSGNLNDVIYTGTMPTLSSSINGSTWTLTHEKMPTLIDGESYTIVINLSADNNIIGIGGNNTSVLIDTSAPMKPNISLTNDSTNGGNNSFNSDNITNDAAIVAPENIETDGIAEYRIKANGGSYGSWGVYNSPTADGVYTIDVRQTDKAGNVSEIQSLSFTLDTTAPEKPNISLVANKVNGFVNDAAITMSTNTEAGAIVKYRIKVGSNPYGSWKNTYTKPTADSAYIIDVKQIDKAGNTSEIQNLSFTLEAATPTPISSSAWSIKPIATQIGFVLNDKIEITLSLSEALKLGTASQQSNNKIIIGGIDFFLDTTATTSALLAEGKLIFSHTVVANQNISIDDFDIDAGDIKLEGISDIANNGVTGISSAVELGTLGQWAVSATSDTSAHSTPASKATGAPNSPFSAGNNHDTGDANFGWISQENTGILTLTYDKEVYIQHIFIGDLLSRSKVSIIEVWKNDVFVEVYKNTINTEIGGTLSGYHPGKVSDMIITLDNVLNYLSNKIRLTFINKKVGNNVIDAVGLTKNFLIDTIIPTFVAETNSDNNILTKNPNLIIDFSEAIKAGTGNIEIWKVGDTSATATIDILTATINDNQLIVNLEEDLTEGSVYYIKIPRSVVTDVIGNVFTGIDNIGDNKWTFQVGTVANTVINFTGVGVDSSDGINANELDKWLISGIVSNGSVNKISTISNFQFFKDGSTIPAVTIDTVAIDENGAWSVANSELPTEDGKYDITFTLKDGAYSTQVDSSITIDAVNPTPINAGAWIISSLAARNPASGDRVEITLSTSKALKLGTVEQQNTNKIIIDGIDFFLDTVATTSAMLAQGKLIFSYIVDDENISSADFDIDAGDIKLDGVNDLAGNTISGISSAVELVSGRQWVIEASASNNNIYDHLLLGEPDTHDRGRIYKVGDTTPFYPFYATTTWNEGFDPSEISTLTLTYNNAVYMEKVIVREVSTPGEISKVEVWKNNAFEVVYTKTNSGETGGIMTGVQPGKISDTIITLTNALDYLSNKIRLTIGVINGKMNAIDSVELIAAEFYVDTQAPDKTIVATAKKTSLESIEINAQTDSSITFAYIVEASITPTKEVDIIALDDNQYNRVNLASNTTAELSLATLAIGDYKIYIVDKSGNISEASDNIISIVTALTKINDTNGNVDISAEALATLVERVNPYLLNDHGLNNTIQGYNSRLQVVRSGDNDNTLDVTQVQAVVTNVNQDLSNLFNGQSTFNNMDVMNFNTSDATTMAGMFSGASSFNQDISNWDISKITTAQNMLTGATSFGNDNYNKLLVGWSNVNTSVGETGVNDNVNFSNSNVQNIYTEATARQFFVNKGWNLSDTLANGVIVGENSANILDQSSETTIQNIHGLGGNDTLTGGSVNDIITGGNGNDTLQGNGGADTFKYHFKTAGNDTILDFDTNSDKIDLSILLDGYNTSSTLSNFIASTGNGSNTIISVDANGGEAFETDISITLIGVTGVNLTSLISSGNLVLE